MDLDEEPPEVGWAGCKPWLAQSCDAQTLPQALAASVSAPKSSAASKSPANSAPSAPSAAQTCPDHIHILGPDLSLDGFPLKRNPVLAFCCWILILREALFG